MAGSLPDDRNPTSGSKRVSDSFQLADFGMLPKCGYRHAKKRRQNAGCGEQDARAPARTRDDLRSTCGSR